jgi:Histidine kinase-, DNA gyrase B-, and HSP90-like ATPase
MLDGLAGPLNDKEREYLGNVLRNAKQLNSLINDLLDAASANVGKLVIEPARVEASDVIQQVLQMFEPRARARRVDLAPRVGSNPPPILADRVRLPQIVINLLENALKFTDPGGAITLSAGIYADDPNFVHFSVSDTGKGINPENLERIFDRLYQEQNAVSNRKGLGLGLAICKELVERHGGRIWVESTLGKGSVFSFIVPVFSLPQVVAPLLLQDGHVVEPTLVVVEVFPSGRGVTEESWEFGRRRCREIVERCMLPDKDLVLPSMHTANRREVIFVLANADAAGALVLETRIRGQLSAASQIAKTCIHKAFCVPLPPIPSWISQTDSQLEWISSEIEKAVLEIGTA